MVVVEFGFLRVWQTCYSRLGPEINSGTKYVIYHY